MPTDPENPTPANGEPLQSILGGLNPDELFARGMQSVRMTGGGSMQNWEPPTIEEAARLFPNYRVVDVLGRGGMGAVYKAVQTALDRVVAIKLLPLEISIDRDFADRFVREARTMAKLNHPNIVSVFDFGTTPEGHLYFVMEFVEGTTLHHLIKTTGLKPVQCLELIVSVCEALQYAHGEGVVHRDIKPANVLVDMKGRVKVADFGLARMDSPTSEQWGQTMTGMVLGTPDYMAPEQKSGSRVDHRADIYSLGVMLYEMLCGQIPQGIFAPPSQRVSVDERIDQVVIRAMQQEPDRRYANTKEMQAEVENIRNTPLPKNGGAPVVPAAPGSKKLAPPARFSKAVSAAAAAEEEADEMAEEQKKSAVPWLAIVAALCAVVAVSVVMVQMMKPLPGPVATIPPPTPPELEPIKAASEPAKPEPEPAKTEPVVAKADPVPPAPEPVPPPKTEPVMAKTEPPPEPPAPVAPPPSEPPVAVMPAPAPAPVVVQVAPPPATTGLVPAPVQPMPVPFVPVPGIPVAEPVDNLTGGEDWRRYVAAGDSLMNRRLREEAIEAYLTGFDLATDGRVVTAAEISALCRKTANLQIRLGSRAEARLTLERGRTVLKRLTNPKDALERQRSIEAIETQLRTLPRD